MSGEALDLAIIIALGVGWVLFFIAGIWEIIGLSVLTWQFKVTFDMSGQPIIDGQAAESEAQARMRMFSAQWRLFVGGVAYGSAAAILVKDVSTNALWLFIFSSFTCVTICGAAYLWIVSVYCPARVLRRPGIVQRMFFVWMFAISFTVSAFLVVAWIFKGADQLQQTVQHFPYLAIVLPATGLASVLKALWNLVKAQAPIFTRPLTYAEMARKSRAPFR
jgi:hypothetical protein